MTFHSSLKGEYHGPYWYSYTWTGEKTISKYRGKNRPEATKVEEE